MSNNLTPKTGVKSLLPFSLLMLLTGCTGGESGPLDAVDAPPPAAKYWEVPTPDFSDNPNRPAITLTGDHTLFLTVGSVYTELGATATDAQDGDLTAQIDISHEIDTSRDGDYLVRYSVSDSNGNDALEAVRIVRVAETNVVNDSPRPFGTTMSHLGYAEHLPVDYGRSPEQTFPLIIYNHGNAANATFGGDEPLSALNLLLQNAGPPLLINKGKWDESLPFIVLMPQMSFVEGSTPTERMNAFVDFAVHTYAVDPSRIYMAGWSQGGFLSIDYGIHYPDRVAAVVSVSGGNPHDEGELDYFCDIETVPVWLFHGDADDVVDVANSVEVYENIERDCQPTTLPRLSIMKDRDHVVHHSIFNLTAMDGGSLEVEYDEQYQSYDQSIFDWLLSHSR